MIPQRVRRTQTLPRWGNPNNAAIRPFRPNLLGGDDPQFPQQTETETGAGYGAAAEGYCGRRRSRSAASPSFTSSPKNPSASASSE